MACSGAVVFGLVNGQYLGRTDDGTDVTVVRGSDGLWRLTALGQTYLADNVQASPLRVTFRSVRIGCGVVDIVLSADMGPCSTSSLSVSSSASKSSSSSSSSRGTIQTTCCHDALIPELLHGTVTMKVACDCFLDNWELLYNGGSGQWEGPHDLTVCGHFGVYPFLSCVSGVWTLGIVLGGGQTLVSVSCDPLQLVFDCDGGVLCPGGSFRFTVTP